LFNSVIASLLNRFSPDRLRFVMIDSKGVELRQYHKLPNVVGPDNDAEPRDMLINLDGEGHDGGGGNGLDLRRDKADG
jgi:DNA segregation ATPase FtsK/SpoIIIE-like protein